MAAAVAALAAQEHARRVQEVTAAFHRARATSPARARTLAELRVPHAAAAESLAQAGVLVRGWQPDTWYLDEAVAAARQVAEAEAARKRPFAVLVGVALGVLVAAAITWAIYRG